MNIDLSNDAESNHIKPHHNVSQRNNRGCGSRY